MRKSVGIVALLAIFFVAGYFTASWRFVYSDTHVLTESIRITSKQGSGFLPAGTELHYQSMAHGDVDFYIFVRIPRDVTMAKTQKIEVNTYYGINRLEYSVK